MPDNETLSDADIFGDLEKSSLEFGEALTATEPDEPEDQIAAEIAEGKAVVATEEPDEKDVAEGQAAEEGEPAADEDGDRYAAAPNASYVVDGKTVEFPHIKMYVDENGVPQGAMINLTDLPHVQSRLSKADYYEANFQTAVDRAATSKLATLEFTDGSKTMHKGEAAFDAALLENAKLAAVTKLFAETIENPESLIDIAYAMQQAIQAGQNPADVPEFKRLQRDLGYALKDADYGFRDARGKQRETIQQTTHQESQHAATRTSEINGAVSQWSAKYPALTADDKQDAIAYLTKIGTTIVRPASPEEAKTYGIQPGALITDHPVIDAYLANVAKIRSASTASASTQQRIAAENAQRKAAAKIVTTKKPVTTAKATVPSEDTNHAEWLKQAAAWDRGEFYVPSE
jgi:hypothetical protein